MDDAEMLESLRVLVQDSRELDARLKDMLDAFRHGSDGAAKMLEISDKVRKVFELYRELAGAIDGSPGPSHSQHRNIKARQV
jgi:hypothetical protein